MWAGLEYALGVYAGFFRTGDEVCVDSGQFVDLPGTSGNYISTPDTGLQGITIRMS